MVVMMIVRKSWLKYLMLMYIETRKQRDNRKYKLPEEVLKTVNEKL